MTSNYAAKRTGPEMHEPREQRVVPDCVKDAKDADLGSALQVMEGLRQNFATGDSPTMGGLCLNMYSSLEFLLSHRSTLTDDRGQEWWSNFLDAYQRINRIYEECPIDDYRENVLLERVVQTYDCITKINIEFAKLGRIRSASDIERSATVLRQLMHLILSDDTDEPTLTKATLDFGARYNCLKNELEKRREEGKKRRQAG